MREPRTSDLALLLGHTMQCEACRQRLLEEPERVLVGRKISEAERRELASLTDTDFEDTTGLAKRLGVDQDELARAQDHPRARLRHL